MSYLSGTVRASCSICGLAAPSRAAIRPPTPHRLSRPHSGSSMSKPAPFRARPPPPGPSPSSSPPSSPSNPDEQSTTKKGGLARNLWHSWLALPPTQRMVIGFTLGGEHQHRRFLPCRSNLTNRWDQNLLLLAGLGVGGLYVSDRLEEWYPTSSSTPTSTPEEAAAAEAAKRKPKLFSISVVDKQK